MKRTEEPGGLGSVLPCTVFHCGIAFLAHTAWLQASGGLCHGVWCRHQGAGHDGRAVVGLQAIETQWYQNKNNVVPAFYFQLGNLPLCDTPNSAPRFCPDLFLYFSWSCLYRNQLLEHLRSAAALGPVMSSWEEVRGLTGKQETSQTLK